MNLAILILVTLLVFVNVNPLRAGATDDSATELLREDMVVEQMRGLNMQPSAAPMGNGAIAANEQIKLAIIERLRLIGKEATPALTHALSDSDVQMRRNAVLVLSFLAGGFDERPKMDIRGAIPALIKATEDSDSDVRAWAAQALGEIGPVAKDAVPTLIKLLKDADEGPRNDSCIALGELGPAAGAALPALQNALNDPSKDVRRFAQGAIDKIQNK